MGLAALYKGGRPLPCLQPLGTSTHTGRARWEEPRWEGLNSCVKHSKDPYKEAWGLMPCAIIDHIAKQCMAGSTGTRAGRYGMPSLQSRPLQIVPSRYPGSHAPHLRVDTLLLLLPLLPPRALPVRPHAQQPFPALLPKGVAPHFSRGSALPWTSCQNAFCLSRARGCAPVLLPPHSISI